MVDEGVEHMRMEDLWQEKDAHEKEGDDGENGDFEE